MKTSSTVQPNADSCYQCFWLQIMPSANIFNPHTWSLGQLTSHPSVRMAWFHFQLRVNVPNSHSMCTPLERYYRSSGLPFFPAYGSHLVCEVLISWLPVSPLFLIFLLFSECKEKQYKHSEKESQSSYPTCLKDLRFVTFIPGLL